ncbi:ABC-2 transporter permease [Ferdinandcohnia quinoae]|uniref:ABC-2 transporter permease n=1 Tax=Fredinandcohnia quinoae TaxID=2918902 RepID=A0AAW5EBZ8_9BACI|nr:ABC-2 transporter permease [Fredinandcohnia sp. SECRCQ15]MCH1626981.1 ABC-2 transporter permease [Fredinandcohnia sp. SECRCQ15]
MFNKALWMRNYKQSKFVIWGFWLVSLYFAYKFYNITEETEYSLANWAKWGNSDPYQFNFGNYFEIPVFQMLLIVTLATVLVGLERSNQSMDFTLSLPFKRKDIFFAKWVFGVVHIFAAVTVSIIISIIILITSVVHDYLPVTAFGYYYIVSLITLIGAYSFSLLIGFIGASIVSQFAFSIIFLALPYGLYNLIYQGFKYHYQAFTGNYFSYPGKLQEIDHLFENLSFPTHLFELDNDIQNIFVWKWSDYSNLYLLIVPIAVTVLSLLFTSILSKKMQSENNGKVLAYEKLQPYLKAGVFICFYLFGGMLVGGSSHRYDEVPSLLPYHLGGLGFSILAYFIVSKLSGLRLQFGKK